MLLYSKSSFHLRRESKERGISMAGTRMLQSSPTKFFKVLMPGFRKKLGIPVAFCLNENKMDAAMIQSCQGSWDVKVGKSGNGQLYFKEGWLKFVNHHSLKVGEFLVFEHKGNMVFNVVAYGLSACEKEYPFPTDSMINGRMTTPHETQRVERPRDDNLEGTHFFRTIMKPSHHDKPYMNIPPSFVEANGIAHKSSMTLIDPSRRPWKVDLKHWKEKKGQRVTMARGWTEFYKANKLKVRDVCIFELHQKTAVSKNVVVNVKIRCH